MLTPILHRVIVTPDPVETKTASGIVIAIDPKKERTHIETGTVVSMGETAFTGDFLCNIKPQKGARVYYAKYAGKIVKDTDNTEYLILNDEDIVAIIQ
jgi:chaperonin GroES